MSGRHAARSSSAVSWPVVAVGIAAVLLIGGAVGFERMWEPGGQAVAITDSTAKEGLQSSGALESPQAPSPPEPGEPVSFSRVQGLVLSLPVQHPEVVGYHQAYYPDAQVQHPIGHLVRNQNTYMFEAPPDTIGPPYRILPSRGRGTPATSAVDIVVKRLADVTSPVTGRVVRAKHYRLYGAYRDWRIEIAPEGHADLRVVMIHLTNVRVRRGDQVSATLTVIGQARKLPFRSQVDDFGGGDPHVHIEVKKLPQKKPK
ncbi:MAG: hypothetical protein WD050_09840 [Actinomycetota bacterium]